MISARTVLYALNALRPVDGNTTKAISDGGTEEFLPLLESTPSGNRLPRKAAVQGLNSPVRAAFRADTVRLMGSG